MFPATDSIRAAAALSNTRRTVPASVLAMVSTALGTTAAILFVPENMTNQGALFMSALALSIGLLAAPVAALVQEPRTALRGEYLLTLAPIYWLLLDLLQGVYALDSIATDQVKQALFAIGLFVVMVWLGAIRRPWRISSIIANAVAREFSVNAYFGLAVTCFFIGMLNFAIPCNFKLTEMIYYLGQDRWAAPWGRGQLGGWDAFLDHLQYFGYLLPVLTIVLSRHVGWRNARTLVCIAMSLVMTLFLAQSGSRRVVGVVIGMALILWVLGHPSLRIKHVVQTGIAIAMLLLALQIMLEYRNYGLGVLVGVQTEASEVRREKYGFLEGQHLRVDDNFFRLCQIIELIPKTYPFVYDQYLVYVIVRPIPRVFWPEKPVDPGFDLPAAVGVEGVSYSYSVVGELYMSMGFIGIAIGGWFYGRVAATARGLLARSRTLGALLLYSVVVMALFSGMRSILELLLVSYVVLAWIALSKLFTKLVALRA